MSDRVRVTITIDLDYFDDIGHRPAAEPCGAATLRNRIMECVGIEPEGA